MNKIVIGIPTFKRQHMLVKLLRSIDNANTNNNLIGEITVLVVDNDIARSAEQTIQDFSFKTSKNIQLIYENCVQRGLATVRNRIFESALSLNPNYIVGIDDDEYVSKQWLLELMRSITENISEIAMGPVVPEFEISVPNYTYKWFRPRNVAKNHKIKFFDFESNNFIIDANFVKRHDLKFDERFNFIGSEDSYFGVTALKNNAKIVWSQNAIVFENIPITRTKLVWLIERKFRTSNVYTFILIIEKKYLLLFVKLSKSLFYLVAGLPLLILYLFPIKEKYNGIVKLAEAVGGISAFFRIRSNGY